MPLPTASPAGVGSKHIAGAWRGAFVLSAVFALYLKAFVLLARFFLGSRR